MSVSRRLLAFAVLGAPLAWAAQLVAGYAVEEAACTTGSGVRPVLDVDAEPILAGISGLAVVVALLAGATGLVAWRRAGDEEPTDDARGGRSFLAAAGALGALVFLIAIAMSGLALVALDPCGRS